MSKWHGGKGSAPRKGNNQKQYEDNWEEIFGKSKTAPDSKPDKPEPNFDYSIYTDYDHRDITVKLFSELDPMEQSFHKMGNTVQWQVYQTALKYVQQFEHMEKTINSDEWPPIKLQK